MGAPAGKEGDPSPESKLAFGEVGDEEPLLGLTRDCKRNKDTLSIQEVMMTQCTLFTSTLQINPAHVTPPTTSKICTSPAFTKHMQPELEMEYDLLVD